MKRIINQLPDFGTHTSERLPGLTLLPLAILPSWLYLTLFRDRLTVLIGMSEFKRLSLERRGYCIIAICCTLNVSDESFTDFILPSLLSSDLISFEFQGTSTLTLPSLRVLKSYLHLYRKMNSRFSTLPSMINGVSMQLVTTSKGTFILPALNTSQYPGAYLLELGASINLHIRVIDALESNLDLLTYNVIESGPVSIVTPTPSLSYVMLRLMTIKRADGSGSVRGFFYDLNSRVELGEFSVAVSSGYIHATSLTIDLTQTNRPTPGWSYTYHRQLSFSLTNSEDNPSLTDGASNVLEENGAIETIVNISHYVGEMSSEDCTKLAEIVTPVEYDQGIYVHSGGAVWKVTNTPSDGDWQYCLQVMQGNPVLMLDDVSTIIVDVPASSVLPYSRVSVNDVPHIVFTSTCATDGGGRKRVDMERYEWAALCVTDGSGPLQGSGAYVHMSLNVNTFINSFLTELNLSLVTLDSAMGHFSFIRTDMLLKYIPIDVSLNAVSNVFNAVNILDVPRGLPAVSYRPLYSIAFGGNSSYSILSGLAIVRNVGNPQTLIREGTPSIQVFSGQQFTSNAVLTPGSVIVSGLESFYSDFQSNTYLGVMDCKWQPSAGSSAVSRSAVVVLIEYDIDDELFEIIIPIGLCTTQFSL